MYINRPAFVGLISKESKEDCLCRNREEGLWVDLIFVKTTFVKVHALNSQFLTFTMDLHVHVQWNFSNVDTLGNLVKCPVLKVVRILGANLHQIFWDITKCP